MLSSNQKPTFSRAESESFVRALMAEARDHRALQHPYLESLAEATFPDPVTAIGDLAFQYLPYSNDFLRYLTATISTIESRDRFVPLPHLGLCGMIVRRA